MRFGERLRTLRKWRGLTQAQVAKAVDVSTRQYSSYERRDKRPRYRQTYVKLAEVLGCNINDLLMEDGSEPAESFGLKTHDSGLNSLLASDVMSATALAAGIPLAIMGPAGVAIALGVTTAVTGLTGDILHSISSKEMPATYAEEVLKEYRKAAKTFAMMSRGLINTALDKEGIQHHAVKEPSAAIDDAIALDTDIIKTWWICYYGGIASANDSTEVISADTKAKLLIGRYLNFAPDASRKASVVVDNYSLYEALLRLKNSNSFRGNLSAILIDSEDVEISEEEYLSTYHEGGDSSNLPYVKKCVGETLGTVHCA